jgi:Bacterial SH3 domain
MRSVRCDACGTKALMAASQCPKCGHLFDVRDGFGELLPLAYCTTCESYYPESLGSCRWCGTKPAPPPIAPRVWKAAGVAALGVVLLVGWLLRDSRPKHASDVASTAPGNPKLVPVADTPAPTPVDTMPLPKPIETVSGVQDPAPSPRTTSVVSTGTVVPNVSPPSVAPRSVAAQPMTSPPTVDRSAAKAAAVAPPKSSSSSRWVNSVSRGWVIVRAGPSKETRIVASIGPDSRVQLGESKGTWRRIRSRNISGWVEPRSSFAVVQASPRSRLLVER